MNSPARFLILLDNAVPRALLFDSERQLVGEVIEDDGFIVDSLLQSATACPMPHGDMLKAMVPPPSPDWPVRCFQLR
jgi:hypothetical protein